MDAKCLLRVYLFEIVKYIIRVNMVNHSSKKVYAWKDLTGEYEMKSLNVDFD